MWGVSGRAGGVSPVSKSEVVKVEGLHVGEESC